MQHAIERLRARGLFGYSARMPVVVLLVAYLLKAVT